MNPHYDAEEVFDNELAPLLRQVSDWCTEHGVPFILSFAICQDEEGIRYSSTFGTFDGRTPDKYLQVRDLLLADSEMVHAPDEVAEPPPVRIRTLAAILQDDKG